jgi:hypothetical protein
MMPSGSKLMPAPDAFQGRPREGRRHLTDELKVNKTYSTTEPKRVVFGITAFCHLIIYRFEIPLWPKEVRVPKHGFVPQDVPAHHQEVGRRTVNCGD